MQFPNIFLRLRYRQARHEVRQIIRMAGPQGIRLHNGIVTGLVKSVSDPTPREYTLHELTERRLRKTAMG